MLPLLSFCEYFWIVDDHLLSCYAFHSSCIGHFFHSLCCIIKCCVFYLTSLVHNVCYNIAVMHFLFWIWLVIAIFYCDWHHWCIFYILNMICRCHILLWLTSLMHMLYFEYDMSFPYFCCIFYILNTSCHCHILLWLLYFEYDLSLPIFIVTDIIGANCIFWIWLVIAIFLVHIMYFEYDFSLPYFIVTDIDMGAYFIFCHILLWLTSLVHNVCTGNNFAVMHLYFEYHLSFIVSDFYECFIYSNILNSLCAVCSFVMWNVFYRF